ncbi:RNA-directed DNA polymerase, eukaryota, reverse transcriptase zinc-binding domain protein [Tanacetum coccineum]
MGKTTNHTDSNGWTWIFRNDKTSNSKPIGNTFYSDVDKVATSFYVTNFPDSLDARGLWNIFTPYGRLVDAFIANKRSKAGKRFGFIRYLGVTDVTEFARDLIIAKQKSTNVPTCLNQTPILKPNHNPNLTTKNTSQNRNDSHRKRHSFASVVHGKTISTNDHTSSDKTRVVSLNDQDLIGIDDSSKSINIVDEVSSFTKDENEVEKDVESLDDNSVDGLEDVLNNLNNNNEDEESDVGPPKVNVEDSQIAKEANTSDLLSTWFRTFEKGSLV